MTQDPRPESSARSGPPDTPAAPPDRAEPGARRGWQLPTEWPIILVLLGVLASLGVLLTGQFRGGSVLLAGAVVLAMFLRLLLRDDEAGLLAVRARPVDLAVLVVLGIGLAVLAFIVPPPP